MKNSSDTIRNRTRDLPTCSAVPQPTAPPCASAIQVIYGKIIYSRKGHIWQYGTRVFHGGERGLQTHIQNMQYLFLFHYNSGCTKVPHCCVIRTLSVLFYFAYFANWATRIGLRETYQCANGFLPQSNMFEMHRVGASPFVAKTAVVGMELEGSVNGKNVWPFSWPERTKP